VIKAELTASLLQSSVSHDQCKVQKNSMK